VYDENEFWYCEVIGDGPWGGFSDDFFDEEEPWTPYDVERLLVHVTQQVCDNLWPDELTDPWPLCPAHPDHPLQPRLSEGRASWVCSRDSMIAFDIGRLK
jgi:hypothetical protein